MKNSMLLKLAGAGLALALSATTVWAKADTSTQPIAEPALIQLAQADSTTTTTTTDTTTTTTTPSVTDEVKSAAEGVAAEAEKAVDASSVAKIFVNTNAAAAAGVIVTVFLTQIFYRKVDVTMAMNGALAGLVSITAEPLMPSVATACFIGGIGGLIVVVFVPLLDKMRIDDVVGAIPVHLCAGIWGTMIVPFSYTGAEGDPTYYVQFIGVVSIGALAFFSSLIVWLILAAVIGLRATPEEEAVGLDSSEVGVLAYPEFGSGRV